METVEVAGYVLLTVDPEQFLRAGRLPSARRDPFDRIIAAQALSLDVPVITPDAQLKGLVCGGFGE